MANETWKPVTDWEGLYEVSDQGGIRSLDREITNENGVMRYIHGRTLSPSTTKEGYAFVRLSDGDRQVGRLLHRLVAESFGMGEGRPTEYLRHRNGDRLDNRLENLEWAPRSEIRDPKKKCPRGHLHGGRNNADWAKASGKRSCLSCARARSVLVRRGVPYGEAELQALSDEYYAAITARG